jgi:hypothetical protein
MLISLLCLCSCSSVDPVRKIRFRYVGDEDRPIAAVVISGAFSPTVCPGDGECLMLFVEEDILDAIWEYAADNNTGIAWSPFETGMLVLAADGEGSIVYLVRRSRALECYLGDVVRLLPSDGPVDGRAVHAFRRIGGF